MSQVANTVGFANFLNTFSVRLLQNQNYVVYASVILWVNRRSVSNVNSHLSKSLVLNAQAPVSDSLPL